jgi:hypothetical protein
MRLRRFCGLRTLPFVCKQQPVGEQTTGECWCIETLLLVAALYIEAAPRPLQALLRRVSWPARRTCVVLWWEVSPVFTTD